MAAAIQGAWLPVERLDRSISTWHVIHAFQVLVAHCRQTVLPTQTWLLFWPAHYEAQRCMITSAPVSMRGILDEGVSMVIWRFKPVFLRQFAGIRASSRCRSDHRGHIHAWTWSFVHGHHPSTQTHSVCTGPSEAGAAGGGIGCTGHVLWLVYALTVADSLIKTGTAQRAWWWGAEVFSRILNL